MKRSFFCWFCIAALILPLCSCDGEKPGAGTGDEPGWVSRADNRVTLSWYINFSWFTTTWGGNLVSETITKETGIDINFVTPGGNEREKLAAMLESETLPDFITLGHWEPEVAQMIEAGLVCPLNELADEYDPYFWKAAHPERVAWYTKPDGNMYAYPNSSYAPGDYGKYKNMGSNQAFLVRKDIYEAIGSPDMTTPEGFIRAVRDAAEKFPMVGGEPLLPIGLYDFDKDGCFSLEEILMNFLAVPFEKDGEKYDRYTDEDYITWLKTFRALTEEGYIKDEVFIDKRKQMAEKIAEGRYFCMLYQHTDIADQQKLLYNQNPDMAYIAVDGPKNAHKDDPTLPGVGINGWTVTLISKNCKYPDRAIQFMTYLLSEHGQKLTYLGVEGQTYDMEEGRPVIRPDVLELLNSDRVAYNKLYAADNTYWMLQDSVTQLDWQLPLSPPLAQPREWTYPYTVYAAQYDANFGTNAEAANANRMIREEWGRTLPKLLFSKSEDEFDEVFKSFLENREALGFDIVMREGTKQMNDAKDRLSSLFH